MYAWEIKEILDMPAQSVTECDMCHSEGPAWEIDPADPNEWLFCRPCAEKILRRAERRESVVRS